MARIGASALPESGIARNPFSVSYVQPGTIPYFFETAYIEKIRLESPLFFTQAFVDSLRSKTELSTWVGCRYLLDRFTKAGYRGQIIGPHGSGKSTLTVSLTKVLKQTGINTVSFVLHDGTRKLPPGFFDLLPPDSSEQNESLKTVVILDGYEQLNYKNRIKLRQLCAARHYGLLITTHTKKWFAGPVLYRTSPSDATLRKIVDYLLDDDASLPSDPLLKQLLMKHKTNFRSILFKLYDWYEGRRP